MSERQENIDELLAEVSALADEAVADLGAESPQAPSQSGAQRATPASAAASGAATARAVAGVAARPETETDRSQTSQPANAPRSDQLDAIMRLEVPVIVHLAERTMPLREIMGLTTGAIIEFEKPSDAELELMINNKRIGRGHPVKVGENFGLRVSRIGSVRDRIKAMGG